MRVRKNSTGKYYALKIQRKKDLVETYLDDPKRLETEKTVFACCHHPFIVDLDYSMQTPTCALLVLSLANAGNLQDVINDSPDFRVPVERVVFYSAEITLAIAHLHDLNLMYRDLKPSNVLLCEDGHIQLADMGGVADCGGSVLGKDHVDPRLHRSSDGKNRRRSIMGTKGYMAPEMVKLLGQKRYERVGYTFMVDYWSLGITIYKLLTGLRPFDKKKYEAFLQGAGTEDKHLAQKNKEYGLLLQEVSYPGYLSTNSKSIVQGLLEHEEEKRLDVRTMMKHEFFAGIDWDKLSSKHVMPPFKPIPKVYPTKTSYGNFDSMLSELSSARTKSGQYDVDWKEEVADSDQKLFNTWDFVSPHTLKVEMGIAGEMEAHDTNFKVQQIMGASNANDNRLGAGQSPKGESRGLLESFKNITPIEQGRKLVKRMSYGAIDSGGV